MIAHLLEGLLVTAGSSRSLPASIAVKLRRTADQHLYHLLFQVLRSLISAGERIAPVLAG